MTAPQPHRPLPIRLINATGRVVSRVALNVPSLEEEALLRAARKRTGLEHFGPETFRPGLQKLLESLERDAALTTIGRLFTRGQVVSLLANRLMLIDHRKRHPELDHEQISQPLFVLGLPRTGTSILHALLAQDPAHRSPLAWEVAFPCPPPESATYDVDPRIARTDRQFDQLRKLAPGFDAIHPIAARLPQECVAILAHEFQSIQFSTTSDVPSYLAWLEQQNMRPAYRFHRQFLQHLQSRRPGGRWVLKTPAHLMAIDVLLDVYPDAMIVQTHRDPVEVMASVSSLHCVLRGATSDDVNPHHTGREQLENWSRTLQRGMEARERHARHAEQFFDLHYPDLLADPLGCVRRTYEHFDLKLTDEAAQRMKRFLADHAQHTHGVHRYTPETFGIDPVRDARHFQDYCDRYGVKRTKR
jgi:hypothetical protein